MSEVIAVEFMRFFKQLPTIGSTCRIFERNDSYCFYGSDADLINKVFSAAKLKTIRSETDSLNYVTLTRGHLARTLQHLLFVVLYKVEIYRNNGSVRSPLWTVVGKASPGNLAAVEDVLFPDDNSYVITHRGVMAVKAITKDSNLVIGIAYCDPLLREIQICEFSDTPQMSMFQSVLAQLSPQECLLPSSKSKQKGSYSQSAVEEMIQMHKIAVTECADFNAEFIVQDLNRLLKFDEGQDFQNSMKDESEMTVALSSVACVVKYLDLLSDENNFGQFILSIFKFELYAKVDLSCEIGLGLFPELKSDYHDKTYLFGFLNSCFTSAGERLLIQWIKQPLMDIRKINERLDIVEIFVSNEPLLQMVAKIIDKFIDVEMICRKIQKRKASLTDLYKIYQMINKLPTLKDVLEEYDSIHHEVLRAIFVAELKERIEDFENFISMIGQTLDFGGIDSCELIVKADFDDDLKDLNERMKKLTNDMTAELDNTKDDLGLQSVKLEKFEKLGYTFRLTLKEEYHLRNKKKYAIIDTRTSGVRFQSPELKELNDSFSTVKAEYERVQKKIVDEMVEVSASYIQPLKLLGNTVAWLDAALSLARVARKAPKCYIRPKLREKGECHIVLRQCRHPVLEDALRSYIPNDLEIMKEKNKFYFVTGPNMGGKSTYIRSVALTVLLAQLGSFVPCDEAEISIVDAFFTRIGACDKPSKAMSTFMYEMLEVKNMVKCATSSSLLIIDEMGRGTSTYDGYGLSWAISKHIMNDLKAPCLFATHFHDLTTMPNAGNLHVDALCSEKDVTFLYQVKPGICSKSFGIHVAKLASFPHQVLQNAEKKLNELEESHISLEDVDAKFGASPEGKALVRIIRDYSSKRVLGEEPMDVDELDEVTKITSESNFLNESFNLNKEENEAERLLSALEELAKDLKSGE